MTAFEADLVIKTLEGRTIALIEVKNLQGLSRDEAIEMRHTLLEHGYPFHAPYFLLTSQDIGFLWADPKPENPDAPPSYEFPMDKVVARYLEKNPGRRLYGAELELLILQWLNNLTIRSGGDDEEPEKTLARAGFNASVKGASVFFGEAA